MKEYIIKDLLDKAHLILGVDTEHYPWFAVYQFDDGKFCFTESNYGDYGMGYDPYRCNTIGKDSYDHAYFYDVEPYDYMGLNVYRCISSNCGYLMLSNRNCYDIYCISLDGNVQMVDSANSRETAIEALRNRIGYMPEEWKWIDLSEYVKYTPDDIDELDHNQIFVFGSNLKGMHTGGTAKLALQKFNAIMGQGVGLQGNSYAIPTTFNSVDEIKPYVRDFIEFARQNSNLEFFVTRIGCGNAGFSDKEIAPMFIEAFGVRNIVLPRSFVKVIMGIN